MCAVLGRSVASWCADMDDTMAEVTSLNLLIVDDDDGFRQALVHRFLRRGYQVQDAANA